MGVLAFSWGRNSERDSERSAEYQDYSERRKDAFCGDFSGRLLAKCQIEQEQAAREAYQAERDLEAQRDMSLWALAVFIISAITAGLTLWALWYVRGTLMATLEAVDDTGKGTAAMVESNRIAANAQRPWIAIEAALISMRFPSLNIHAFDVSITFKNTGKMVAENFYANAKIVPMKEPFLPKMKEWFDKFELDEGIQLRDTVVIPEQSYSHDITDLIHIDHFPWDERQGFRKDCYYMILAMARYRIPGEKTWRFAMKGFSIGEQIEHIDNRKLIYDRMTKISTESLVVKPMGRSRAT